MDATDVMMTVATAVEDDNWSRTCNSSISPQNPDSLSLSFAYNHNNSWNSLITISLLLIVALRFALFRWGIFRHGQCGDSSMRAHTPHTTNRRESVPKVIRPAK